MATKAHKVLSFLSSRITPDCGSKEALVKLTWQPCFVSGLHEVFLLLQSTASLPH
jgi:hypothetical protein